MSKAEERFRHYEKLVKKADDQAPASCRKCPYYQPEFKYRSCLYVRCPFEKHRSTLRDNKGWFCSSRECRFALWKDNAYFSRLGKHMTGQLAEKLVRDGRAKLKDCKSQKTGKTYNATVLMTTEADGRPQFSLEFDKGGK